MRELVIEVTSRPSFIGTPEQVADPDRDLGRRGGGRRLHPGPPHHPGRARRVRRHGGAHPPGARPVPHRVRGTDPARPPRAPAGTGPRPSPRRRGRPADAARRGYPSACWTWCRSARGPIRRPPCTTASTWPGRPRPSATPATGSPSTTSIRGWPARRRPCSSPWRPPRPGTSASGPAASRAGTGRRCRSSRSSACSMPCTRDASTSGSGARWARAPSSERPKDPADAGNDAPGATPTSRTGRPRGCSSRSDRRSGGWPTPRSWP